MTRSYWVAAIGALVAVTTVDAIPPGGNVRFVDSTNPTPGNGLTWQSAYVDLQAAIDQATVNPAIDTIWVAAGTYIPGPDHEDHFYVPSGVTIRGGFQAGDNDTDDQDWFNNQTILDGNGICDHVVFTEDTTPPDVDPRRQIDGV